MTFYLNSGAFFNPTLYPLPVVSFGVSDFFFFSVGLW